MTFNQVWDQIVHKHPVLNDPKSVVEFESRNLKKLLEQVFDKGREDEANIPFPQDPP